MAAVKDALMLLVLAAFFALCVAYVWWCDQIIGPDPSDVRADVWTDVDANPAAPPAEEVLVALPEAENV